MWWRVCGVDLRRGKNTCRHALSSGGAHVNLVNESSQFQSPPSTTCGSRGMLHARDVPLLLSRPPFLSLPDLLLDPQGLHTLFPVPLSACSTLFPWAMVHHE